MTTRAAAERHKPDAAYQSAQVVEIAGFAIDRREADRCEVQSEVRHGAKDQHPCPHEDVDAVLDPAHPARQHDLRQVEQSRAQDADGEGEQRVALGSLALAIGGKDVDRLVDEAGKEALRSLERVSRRCILGAPIDARGRSRIEPGKDSALHGKASRCSIVFEARPLTITDEFGNAAPSPCAAGVSLFTVVDCEKVGDLCSQRTMLAFQNLGHRADIPGRGCEIHVGVPVARNVEVIVRSYSRLKSRLTNLGKASLTP